MRMYKINPSSNQSATPSLLIFDEITDNNVPESISSDGKTLGLASPSASSQEACIREAYARAGIDNISATGFFECHGTGTVAGDPAEAMSVGKVFGRGLTKDEPLYIGSIKPNVGHGEGASALNGIIKGVLALEAGQIPPNIYFGQPNPRSECTWPLKHYKSLPRKLTMYL